MDSQCDSNRCLEPFGSGEHYCTIGCPVGDERPVGYGCQDSGTSWGSVCYRQICVYGGSDATDCVTNTIAELQGACASGCGARAGTWLDCLVGAGRICSTSAADSACGIERGLLESCCFACSSSEW